ncbi:hypothetical protein CgunFtcFv8_001359 [Champsocephalus gunnari]|uniref:Rho-GAP domain-containing protein n=1 Tax=Champsocephalus gunnari TaxID=52237 RepID=A0AAN8H7L0_CHAGU|nr:hypothetical protein CgunFtcFv8_001359 [Champsocephalus gunnari]
MHLGWVRGSRIRSPVGGLCVDAPPPAYLSAPPPAYLSAPPPPAGGSSEGQRSYLQSLERSSRAWVLSSQGGGNIWYNPIPEEEGGAGPPPEGGRVRRRREELRGGRPAESPAEGANPSVSHQTDDITEHTDSAPSDSSPASTKKGGVSSSVIDRLRSPGTVRKLSMKMKTLPELRRKLSLRSTRGRGGDGRAGGDESTSKNTAASTSNQNVISRYHLDSSAPPARPLRRSSRGRSAKGGYLSDGDSPELLPRQQAPPLASPQETCDVSSFQMYSSIEPPRNSQRVTGLLTVHLLGLEELKSSGCSGSKQVFLAIQVDGVTRARTSQLTLRGSALPLNHAFHLQLERARLLRLLLLTPAPPAGGPSDPPSRNRVCALGGVCIPPLFKGSRSQQLCVRLEPRGLIYLKLSLQENWDNQSCSESSGPANVFGVDLHHLVEKEGSSPPIPRLITKCVSEIERRGLKVVGLYRLCGSASVKKDLRDWFERNSSAVCLSDDLYPDINVLTGILKDYLRELPSPLITSSLYQVVREALTLQPPAAPPTAPDPEQNRRTVELLTCLPPPERATLSLLLDHLSLVASLSPWNRMTHQNLAVCFGPLWPVPTNRVPSDDHSDACPPPAPSLTHKPLRKKQPRLPALRLAQSPEQEVVSRRGRDARLESPPPINRYAGDWSVCGRDFLSGQEADYDEVAGSDSDGGSSDEEEQKKRCSSDEEEQKKRCSSDEEEQKKRCSSDEEEQKKGSWSSAAAGPGLYVEEFLDFDAPFNCRLSLKDFDTLIHDLERELIHICL